MLNTQNQDHVINISAHIPLRLAGQLAKIAKLEERTKSYCIRKALEKYIAEKMEDIEDYEDAKKAWDEFKASGEKAIPFEQIKFFRRHDRSRHKNVEAGGYRRVRHDYFLDHETPVDVEAFPEQAHRGPDPHQVIQERA